MQPYIVEKITDADGRVVSEMEPTVKRQVIRPGDQRHHVRTGWRGW